MASVPADPYRTLGLRPGAGLAEVKRAYRHLVKEVHPDFAGPASLPRFLAIQAAYEALVGTEASGPGSRGSWPGGEPYHGPGTPWRQAPPAGSRPGGSRSGSRPGRGSDGTGESGPRGPRPAWQADPDRARATWDEARRSGSRAGSRAEEGAAGRAGSPGRGQASPRPRRRATFGSTSYDGAEAGDPQWNGAGWYGTGSGTYWTLNPREYADPRKHGPEYQARARALAAEERRPATAPAASASPGASSTIPADASRAEETSGPFAAAAAEAPTGATTVEGSGSRPNAPGPDPAGARHPQAPVADIGVVAGQPGFLDRLRRAFFG